MTIKEKLTRALHPCISLRQEIGESETPILCSKTTFYSPDVFRIWNSKKEIDREWILSDVKAFTDFLQDKGLRGASCRWKYTVWISAESASKATAFLGVWWLNGGKTIVLELVSRVSDFTPVFRQKLCRRKAATQKKKKRRERETETTCSRFLRCVLQGFSFTRTYQWFVRLLINILISRYW